MEEERKTRPLGEKVTHYKQLKDGEYLGAWDLPEDGSTIKVTVALVQQEELFNTGSNKKEWKNVVRFKNAKKAVVLNATNMDAIASHHGNNPKNWIGKDIELYRANTKVRGLPTECIRVKPKSKSDKAVESVKG